MSDDKKTDFVQVEMEKIYKQNTINPKIAKALGLVFFYHNRIEQEMEKLIMLVLPEMKLQSLEALPYYSNKLKILESMTLYSKKLKIFKLLKKVNRIRNKIAHQDYSKINYEKYNKNLIKIFNEVWSLKLKKDKTDFDFYSKYPKKSEEEILSIIFEYISIFMSYTIVSSKKDAGDDSRPPLYTPLSSRILTSFRGILFVFQDEKDPTLEAWEKMFKSSKKEEGRSEK